MTDAIKYGLVILMFLLFICTSYFVGAPIPLPATASYYFFPEVKANADPWYSRVVTAGEMESTAWINQNTNKTDKFVADIFGAELIMGMTTRVSTVGGDWANAPDPAQAMRDTDAIYRTSDPIYARDLAVKYNCSYVFVPDRYTYSNGEWIYGDHDKFEDREYFLPVYRNPDVSIYKVIA